MTFLKKVAQVLVANSVSSVVEGLTSILIVRALGATDYGIYIIAFVFPSLISSLGSFGLGPSFIFQLMLSESMFFEKPDLYASIQTRNKYTASCLNKFVQETQALRDLVNAGGKEEIIRFFGRIHDAMIEDIEFSQPYKKMYKLLENEH